MNWQQVWGVLKWVLAALAAGFIGQFGKSLALRLMKRRRSKDKLLAPSSPVGASDESIDSVSFEKDGKGSTQAKIEKKRAKAQVKRLKKS